VGGITFERPGEIGQLVEVRAAIVHTGRTSMHVAVGVSARDTTAGEQQRTTHCLMVFVAVDEDRKPVAVPAYVPQTDVDRELSNYAQKMAKMRADLDAELQSLLSSAALTRVG